MKATPLYRSYAAATRFLLPLAYAVERRKLARAGVAKARWGEKRGLASAPRPAGTVIWFHAASVGESLSVLSLITRLGAALPDAEFLITSGTPTSAQLVEARMPPRSRHQFAPLDAPGPLKRFLRHWRPDAAIFVESELWPQMLWRTHQAGVPMALINARLSDRSLAGWSKRPRTARQLFSVFRLILTQSDALTGALVALGAEPACVERGVNLKSLSAPLPQDADLIAQMRAVLGTRPVWVAASTHAGEEVTVLQAHAELLKNWPDLQLVLAPRHPQRGAEVAELITAQGWPVAQRSAGAAPQGPVYLADTLGELGSWYALTPIVFLGGSLSPIGGHNPYEVAQAGAAVISGPHVSNFADTYAGLQAAGGVVFAETAPALARAVDHWLSAPEDLAQARQNAQGFSEAQQGALDTVAAQLIARLELRNA